MRPLKITLVLTAVAAGAIAALTVIASSPVQNALQTILGTNPTAGGPSIAQSHIAQSAAGAVVQPIAQMLIAWVLGLM